LDLDTGIAIVARSSPCRGYCRICWKRIGSGYGDKVVAGAVDESGALQAADRVAVLAHELVDGPVPEYLEGEELAAFDAISRLPRVGRIPPCEDQPSVVLDLSVYLIANPVISRAF
jgi:hypothetical protein